MSSPKKNTPVTAAYDSTSKRMLFAKNVKTGDDLWVIPYLVHFSKKGEPSVRFNIYRDSSSVKRNDRVTRKNVDTFTLWDGMGGSDWNTRLATAWKTHFGEIKAMGDYSSENNGNAQPSRSKKEKTTNPKQMKKVLNLNSTGARFERGENLPDKDLKDIAKEIQEEFSLTMEPSTNLLRQMIAHRKEFGESPLKYAAFEAFCKTHTVPDGNEDDEDQGNASETSLGYYTATEDIENEESS